MTRGGGLRKIVQELVAKVGTNEVRPYVCSAGRKKVKVHQVAVGLTGARTRQQAIRQLAAEPCRPGSDVGKCPPGKVRGLHRAAQSCDGHVPLIRVW